MIFLYMLVPLNSWSLFKQAGDALSSLHVIIFKKGLKIYTFIDRLYIIVQNIGKQNTLLSLLSSHHHIWIFGEYIHAYFEELT